MPFGYGLPPEWMLRNKLATSEASDNDVMVAEKLEGDIRNTVVFHYAITNGNQ